MTDEDAQLRLRPSVCVLAVSAIADDPRVRRQAEAFHRAGWKVAAVGLPGAKSSPPEWLILTRDGRSPGSASAPAPADATPTLAPDDLLTAGEIGPVDVAPVPQRSGIRRWLLAQFWSARKLVHANEEQWQALELRLKRGIGRAHRKFGGVRNRLRQFAVRIRPEVAQQIYWSWSQNILDIYRCAQEVDAAIWLANDWTALPIAARLAVEKGGVYGYDTHEFASEEYAEKWKWRLLQRPMVCALERKFIANAAVVSAVSAGIGERLEAMYRLARPALVIRNTPAYERCAYRPTGPQIRVLYHGIVAIGRGLEAAIDSVARWRPEFDLTIRGPESPGYSDALRKRIRDAGLDGRVRLVPPVPMTELVAEATAFDVGFFALPGHSRHNEFALPNKFFEYVMAGLALCVTDLPEMARLIDQYRLGILIRSPDPAAIAAAVNGLDRLSIDAYKRNALATARELCWERESARMVSAYGALVVGQAAG